MLISLLLYRWQKESKSQQACFLALYVVAHTWCCFRPWEHKRGDNEPHDGPQVPHHPQRQSEWKPSAETTDLMHKRSWIWICVTHGTRTWKGQSDMLFKRYNWWSKSNTNSKSILTFSRWVSWKLTGCLQTATDRSWRRAHNRLKDVNVCRWANHCTKASFLIINVKNWVLRRWRWCF